MLAEVKSVWNSSRRRPNVWLRVIPENDAEKALILALYSVRGKVENNGGSLMIDFYPEGEKRG